MGRYVPRPFSGGVDEIGPYLTRELETIADVIESSTGGASLYRLEPAGQVQVDTTPQLLPFELAIPRRSAVNVLPVLPSALIGRRPGFWGVAFVVNARVERGGEYRVALYVNDAPGVLYSDIDPSNQTDVVSFVGVGSAPVEGTTGPASVRADLRVSADQARDFEFLQGTFTAWRIGV